MTQPIEMRVSHLERMLGIAAKTMEKARREKAPGRERQKEIRDKLLNKKRKV